MKSIIILAVLLLTNPDAGMVDKETDLIQFTGTVIEEMTGEPIPGATIFIKELNKVYHADFDGIFTIDNVMPGTYNLEVQFVSFRKKELHDIKITSEQNPLLIYLN
jgi:hypothetical protein